MATDYVSVNIPKKVYEEVQKRVAESEGEFKTVEEYVEFVLTELIKEEEEEAGIVSNSEDEKGNRERKLGYI